MSEKILNIAGGKFPPIMEAPSPPSFLVNVDTMYYDHTEPHLVEKEMVRWAGGKDEQYNINTNIFEFMERTTMDFDRVCIYRFLEHVSFTQVLYFIYLVSTVTKPGAIVDVIVPDYKILAQMILDEDAFFEENNTAVFSQHDIKLTTELLNEPSCPHASIWTADRAHYFWTLEERFRVHTINQKFKFDGRDLYLRFKVRRI